MYSKVAIQTDIGSRSEQQDHFFSGSSARDAVGFHVICDGAGGHKGGQAASRAVQLLAEQKWDDLLKMSSNTEDDFVPEEFVKNFFTDAHQAVVEIGDSFEGNSRAVMVALLRWKGFLYWGHIGDSRLYIFSGQTLVHKTRDHSLAQSLVESGMISESELASHPDSSKVFRSLGAEKELKPNFGKLEENPHEFRYAILCSDGFWGPLEKEQGGWQPRLQQGDNIERFVTSESQRALTMAGDSADNLSVILVQLGREKQTLQLVEILFIATCFLSGMLIGLLWLLANNKW